MVKGRNTTDKAGSPKVIGYVYPKRFFFVAKDIEGLSAEHEVLEHSFTHGPVWLLKLDLFLQFFFLLKARSRGVRHVIAHFAGYHTVLPVLMGFNTHIIVAGSDACSFPGIGYGSFRKRLMRKAMAYSMRRAGTILPVHDSLERFTNHYSKFGPVEQGYGHFVPGLATPTVPIPYGFDAQQWKATPEERIEGSSICVAFGASSNNAVHFRKGIDLILESAKQLTEHRFTIVGVADMKSYAGAPPNVAIKGRVSPKELAHLFAVHGNVLQPSVMEGFPNALCEAMLCGCIPIVSNITSMPSIVGDLGHLIEQREASGLNNAIRSIERLDGAERSAQRALARQRITEFTMERRMQQIGDVLSQARQA